MFILQIINAVISLSTIVAAGLALAQPKMFSGSRHVVEGEQFFAKMYASRAIPPRDTRRSVALFRFR